MGKPTGTWSRLIYWPWYDLSTATYHLLHLVDLRLANDIIETWLDVHGPWLFNRLGLPTDTFSVLQPSTLKLHTKCLLSAQNLQKCLIVASTIICFVNLHWPLASTRLSVAQRNLENDPHAGTIPADVSLLNETDISSATLWEHTRTSKRSLLNTLRT